MTSAVTSVRTPSGSVACPPQNSPSPVVIHLATSEPSRLHAKNKRSSAPRFLTRASHWATRPVSRAVKWVNGGVRATWRRNCKRRDSSNATAAARFQQRDSSGRIRGDPCLLAPHSGNKGSTLVWSRPWLEIRDRALLGGAQRRETRLARSSVRSHAGKRRVDPSLGAVFRREIRDRPLFAPSGGGTEGLIPYFGRGTNCLGPMPALSHGCGVSEVMTEFGSSRGNGPARRSSITLQSRVHRTATRTVLARSLSAGNVPA